MDGAVGKWVVGSGQWVVGSGQWAVGSRQCLASVELWSGWETDFDAAKKSSSTPYGSTKMEPQKVARNGNWTEKIPYRRFR